jgi:hypothetical protein
MRSQKREKTECNKYNDDQLYVGGRRRDDDSFHRKKVTFCFNRPRNPDVDARSQELKVQKILKSMAFSRRNQDLPDAPVIKPIDTVICPK